MKNFLTTLFLLVCFSGFGQSLQWRNPTTTQFGSNNYVLTIKSGAQLTNPVVRDILYIGGNTDSLAESGAALELYSAKNINLYTISQVTNKITLEAPGGVYAVSGAFTGNGSGLTNLNIGASGAVTNADTRVVNLGNTFAAPKSIRWQSNSVIIVEGDSLSIPVRVGINQWPVQFTNLFPEYTFRLMTNVAASGQDFYQMDGQYTNEVQSNIGGAGTNTTLFFWAGVNNFMTQTVAQVTTMVSDYSNYIWRAHRDGISNVVCFTIPPNDGTGHPFWTGTNEIVRSYFNNWLRTASEADQVVDVARLFPTPSPVNNISASNTIYKDDYTHYITNGNVQIAIEVERVLRTGKRDRDPISFQVAGTNAVIRTPISGSEIMMLTLGSTQGKGMVGIGTGTGATPAFPTSSLEIYEDTSLSSAVVVRGHGSAGNKLLDLDISSQANSLTPSTANGGSSVTVLGGGFTGLGTNSPDARLHVVENVNNANVPMKITVKPATTTNALEVFRTTTNLFILTGNGGARIWGLQAPTNSGSSLSFNFNGGAQWLTTNAAFAFLKPIGVDTLGVSYQRGYSFVTNSTASAVAITADSTINVLGTAYVTNLSRCEWECYASLVTNLYVTPIR